MFHFKCLHLKNSTLRRKNSFRPSENDALGPLVIVLSEILTWNTHVQSEVLIHILVLGQCFHNYGSHLIQKSSFREEGSALAASVQASLKIHVLFYQMDSWIKYRLPIFQKCLPFDVRTPGKTKGSNILFIHSAGLLNHYICKTQESSDEKQSHRNSK